jgi:hypothetical protein
MAIAGAISARAASRLVDHTRLVLARLREHVHHVLFHITLGIRGRMDDLAKLTTVNDEDAR